MDTEADNQTEIRHLRELVKRLEAENAELLDRNAKLSQECGRLEYERGHWKAAFEELRRWVCTCGMDAARKIGEEPR